jgi:hypothetical protein
MRAAEAARAVRAHIECAVAAKDLRSFSLDDAEVVSFRVFTTKARASSIVTRLERLAREVSERGFRVACRLDGERPRKREHLVYWGIRVEVNKKVRWPKN